MKNFLLILLGVIIGAVAIFGIGLLVLLEMLKRIH
jgi:hypothetical protein